MTEELPPLAVDNQTHEALRARYEAHRAEIPDYEGHRVVCCDGCELADELPGLLDLNDTLREQNGYFRDERDALIVRARELRDLHRPTSRRGLSVETCVDCGQRYPCPTVQVLDRPLGTLGVSAREAAKAAAP